MRCERSCIVFESVSGKERLQQKLERAGHHKFSGLQVDMKATIDRERRMTAAVRQLKNDLKDEKADHEEKVRSCEELHWLQCRVFRHPAMKTWSI